MRKDFDPTILRIPKRIGIGERVATGTNPALLFMVIEDIHGTGGVIRSFRRMMELKPALQASFGDISDTRNHAGYEVNGVHATSGWDDVRGSRVHTLTQPLPSGDIYKAEFVVVRGNLDTVVVSKTDGEGVVSGHSVDMRGQRVDIEPFSSAAS